MAGFLAPVHRCVLAASLACSCASRPAATSPRPATQMQLSPPWSRRRTERIDLRGLLASRLGRCEVPCGAFDGSVSMGGPIQTCHRRGSPSAGEGYEARVDAIHLTFWADEVSPTLRYNVLARSCGAETDVRIADDEGAVCLHLVHEVCMVLTGFAVSADEFSVELAARSGDRASRHRILIGPHQECAGEPPGPCAPSR